VPAFDDGPATAFPTRALPALIGATTTPQRRQSIARWQRIGLGIRLAYNPDRADVLRLWIALGGRLAHGGDGEEPLLWRNVVRLLLHTASDQALPWRWRAARLDHTARPVARLTTLLCADETQRDALAAAVERVEVRLLASAGRPV
jgi:hypothetical protein